jgi:hypothetical protein
MIDAVAQAGPRFALDMMLVGDPGYVAELRQRAAASAPERVRFVPPVSPERIVRRIAEYDLGFFLLDDDIYNYAMALPNKFFDFACAGLGVLIGPSPAMRALGEQYGFALVAPAFTAEACAAALRALTTADVTRLRTAARTAGPRAQRRRGDGQARAPHRRARARRRGRPLMCGIYGRWNRGGARIDPAALVAAATAIRHRGPDDEGYLLADTRGGHARHCRGDETDVRIDAPHVLEGAASPELQADLALAFRRLSIVDLSPLGHQPMGSADGRHWLVFNGEVYNYRELRDELRALGHRFRGGSDTEVILAAYREWGPACLERFNGMWAIAVWDVERAPCSSRATASA